MACFAQSFSCHCVYGWLFVSLVGAASHFLYHWSNCAWAVGLLVAVNESVFEHLKLLIFPLLLWWLLLAPVIWMFEEESPPWMRYYAANGNSLFAVLGLSNAAAVSVAILSGTVFIVVGFLFVLYVFAYEAMWLDILLFVAGAWIAQYAAWSLLDAYFMPVGKLTRAFDACDALQITVVLVALVVVYLYFTDNPLRDVPAIFEDTSKENRSFYGRPAICNE